MPNWCHNSMTITGSVEEVARLKQTVGQGTARYADDSFRVYCDEPGHYEFDFDTAWVSPVSAWNKLGEMFPALEFDVCGYDVCDDWGMEGTIKDGKLVREWEEYDLLATVDPETGKTRGSHEAA